MVIPITCQDIIAFLDVKLKKNLYFREIPSLWKDTSRKISRIGLALEPWPDIDKWIEQNRLDAIFLHRPWKITDYNIPSEIGIIAYHLPFDEHLTIGNNSYLANHLHLVSTEIMGTKEGRPLGMMGKIPETSDVKIYQHLQTLFGGVEEVILYNNTNINYIACVGAMTADLIQEATNKGVQIYITGQMRKPAMKSALHLGMSIVAVGHHRSELYGLNLLSKLLIERFPPLVVIIQ